MSKEITKVEDPAKLVPKSSGEIDEDGRKIYKYSLGLQMTKYQILKVHETIKKILEADVVAPRDVKPCFELMDVLAEAHDNIGDDEKKGGITLAANYYFGLWNILNISQQLDIWEKGTRVRRTVDRIVEKIAKNLDAYHRIKEMKEEDDKGSEEGKNKEKEKELLKDLNKSSHLLE